MENLITLAEAAKEIPNRPSTNVIWRWCRRGLKARDGSIVRLAHCRIGGKIYVKKEEVERFFDRLAKADTAYFERQDGFENPNIKPDKLKQDRLDEAERFLVQEGVL